MLPEIYAQRVSQLAELLREAGIGAFFGHHPITMAYLAGFGEDGHERFLTLAVSHRGEVALICPGLSGSQARRAGLSDVRTWNDGEDPLEQFRGLIHEWNLWVSPLSVDDTLPAHMLLRMQAETPNSRYSVDGLVSRLMQRKSSDEIDSLRKAGKIADDTFEEILPKLKPGLSERDVARMIGAAMEQRGGTPTFCIVGAGANGAEGHHLTDDTVIKKGDVLILDFGCSLNGYQSDITRTVAIGEPDPEAHRIYETVFAAHHAARAAIRAGATGADVDGAARDLIVAAGYGPQFMHRTGHGIGMNIHEAPFISPDNKHALEPGNCFSIEPGIYLANRFGVRIENIVVKTPDGHVSLNAEPDPKLMVL